VTARFLLDTNIISDLIRNAEGVVAAKIAQLASQQRLNLCTSILVAAELRFGAAKKNAPRLFRLVEEILGQIEVLPFQPDADLHYARIRVKLESAGESIGANDLFIAAHALASDCILVTDNLREFSRVPGLRVENWLRR
jgi:tRNA(fMet)-specific endonuclease VapC